MRVNPYPLRNFISRRSADFLRPPEGLYNWRTVSDLTFGSVMIGLGIWSISLPLGEYGVHSAVVAAISSVGAAAVLKGIAEALHGLPLAFTVAVRSLSAVLLVSVPVPLLVLVAVSEGVLSISTITMLIWSVIALSQLSELFGKRSPFGKTEFPVKDESRPAPLGRSDEPPRPDKVHGRGGR